jgi:hypothetical protein
MAGLAEFRKQYPQYDDIGDQQLADSLREKFYSDIPKEQYYQSLGIAAAAEAKAPAEAPPTEAGAAFGIGPGMGRRRPQSDTPLMAEYAARQPDEQIPVPRVSTPRIGETTRTPDSPELSQRYDRVPTPTRSLGEVYGDTALAAAQGAMSVPQLPGTVYGLVTGNMDNAYSGFFQRGIDAADELKSPILRERQQQLQDRIDAADGLVGKFGAGFLGTLTDPSIMLDQVARMTPSLVAGAGAGQLLQRGAQGATGALAVNALSRSSPLLAEGAVAASRLAGVAPTSGAVGTAAATQGQSVGMETLAEAKKIPLALWAQNDPGFAEMVKSGVDPAVARDQRAEQMARTSTGLAALASLVTMALPGGRAIETAFVRGKVPLPGGRAASAVTIGGKEGFTESLEEGAGSLAKDAQLLSANPNIDALGNAAGAAGMGAGLGGPMGAAAGAASPRMSQQDQIARALADELNAGQFAPQGIRQAVSENLRLGSATSTGISPAATTVSFTPPDSVTAQAGLPPIVVPTPGAPNVSGTDVSGGLAGTRSQATGSIAGAGVGVSGLDVDDTRGPGTGTAAGVGLGATPSVDADATVQPAARLTPLSRASDADLLARLEQASQTGVEAPQARPVTIWTGRSGDGYGTLEAAQAGLATRLKREPDLRWEVEQMPSGKYQLAGYDPTAAPQETPSAAPQPTQAQQPVSQTPQQAQGDSSTEQQPAQEQTPAQQSPVSVWAGVSGEGYSTPKAARVGMTMLQRQEPGLRWEVEQLPSGKYQLAGYEPAAAPAAATTAPVLSPSGQPFSTAQTATVYAQQNGMMDASPVQVAGGWALQPEGATRAAQAPEAQQAETQEPAGSERQGDGSLDLALKQAPLPDAVLAELSRNPRSAALRAAAQTHLDGLVARGLIETAPQLGEPDADSIEAINVLGALIGEGTGLGQRVVPYKEEGGANGFAVKGFVFINTAFDRNSVSAPRTGFHEIKHVAEQLARGGNKAAQRFIEKIDSIFDDMTDAGKRSYVEKFLHKDALDAITDPAAREAKVQEFLAAPLLRSEMVADFLGNRAQDRAWMLDLAKADPQGFEGFVKRWLAVIDNLITKLRGSPTQGTKESAKVDQYVRDLNKAKMVARDALIEFRRANVADGSATRQDTAVASSQRQAADSERVNYSVRQSADAENRVAVVVGGKPGEFDWDFTKVGMKPPPYQAPTQFAPRLEKIGPAAQKILSSKKFAQLAEDAFGIKGLRVVPLRGSWMLKPEPSFALLADDMSFEQASDMSKLVGFALAQDATVVYQPTSEETPGERPAYYIGNNQKLTPQQMTVMAEAAREQGLDYSTSQDGKAVKFLYFGDNEGLADFAEKVQRVKEAAGFSYQEHFYVRSDLNEAVQYVTAGDSGNLQAVWLSGGAAGSSSLFGRAVDTLVVPYAKAVGAEGYRFSVQRFADKFGLSEAQRDLIRGELLPKTGRSKSTVAIASGAEKLDIESTSVKGGTSVVDIMWALQNRSAQAGLIEPGDYSPQVKKLIAEAIADEVIYHVENPRGGKSAIGWYDRALKAAKAGYKTIFPELATDSDAELLFDALWGITSQGNDVFSNSVFGARVYNLVRDKKTSLPEAVQILRGTFGGETRAIENNILKLHQLLERNGYDAMRKFFNTKGRVADINKTLRADRTLYYDGKPLQVEGQADQTVTGWMVFGPKIGSFINNLHGDYSTLTADLWFSRSWNRILGYSFVHAPALEAEQYQRFVASMTAEFNHLRNRPVEPKPSAKNGKTIAWAFGDDMLGLEERKLEEVIADPYKALEFATLLEEDFRKGGYREKSDLRRAAKNWVENRTQAVAAPRTDLERSFQQDTAEAVQQIVRRRTGKSITIADIQAALWFYEKDDLFGPLGGTNKKSEGADYAGAAEELLRTYERGNLYFNKTDKVYVYGTRGSYLDRFDPDSVNDAQAVLREYNQSPIKDAKFSLEDSGADIAITGNNALDRSPELVKQVAERLAEIARSRGVSITVEPKARKGTKGRVAAVMAYMSAGFNPVDITTDEVLRFDPTAAAPETAADKPAFSRRQDETLEDRSSLTQAYQGYEKAEVPRVQAARNLSGLLRRLDEGKLTPAEFELKVRLLAGRMSDVSEVKSANRQIGDRERGADIVREKLIAARRREEIDPDAVEFALWALQQNPAMAEGLGISVREQPEGSGAAGDYNPAVSVMRVFKGAANPGTAVHEILHHTERMMPAEVQAGIRKEWAKAYSKALADADGPQRAALEQMAAAMAGDQRARQAVSEAFSDGTLDADTHYQLVNPSEFWAVNATDILRRRYDADSWIGKAKQWLGEMLDTVKGLLGLRSDAPILKGLKAVMEGRGERLSGEMLSQGRRFDNAGRGERVLPINPAQARAREAIDRVLNAAKAMGVDVPAYPRSMPVLDMLAAADYALGSSEQARGLPESQKRTLANLLASAEKAALALRRSGGSGLSNNPRNYDVPEGDPVTYAPTEEDRLRDEQSGVERRLQEEGFLPTEEGSLSDFTTLSGEPASLRSMPAQARALAREYLDLQKRIDEQGLRLEDIRYSARQPSGPTTGQAFTLPEMSKVDAQRRRFQDDSLRMRRVIEAVKAQGGTVGEAQNFYDAKSLMAGRVQSLMEDFERDVFTPMVEKAAKAGISMDELALYAYAMHAPERNAYIASINPNLPSGGSGMTDADAAKIVSDVKKSPKAAVFDDLHGDLMAITATTRQVMLQEGLITQDQFDAMEGAYQYYIPLRGFANQDEDTGRVMRGSGINIRGEETIRALGRRSRAGDLIENVMRDYAVTVQRSEKNNVGKVLLDFVLSNPDPDLWGVNVEKRKATFNKSTGLVSYTKGVEKGEDTIGVKVGGEVVYIWFADSDLTRAFRNAWKEETGEFERATLLATGWYNNLLRGVLTRYNPAFALINTVRDAGWSGPAAALSELGVKGTAKYFEVYGKALMAAGRSEANASGTTSMFGNPVLDRQFNEFRAAGGLTGGWYMRSLEDITSDLRDAMLNAGAAPTTLGEKLKYNPVSKAPWRLAQGTMRALEFTGSVSENATRFALYVAAREMGKTPAEAALLGKEGTTNFDRKGEWGQTLNNLFLFYNAAVQGNRQFLRVLRSPKVQMAMAGVTGLGVMLAFTGAAVGGEDEDGESYWDKIPSYEKSRNLIIMLPPGDALADGMDRVGKRGRYIKIPVQYGFNLFPNLGYMIGDVARNAADPKRGKSLPKAALHMSGVLFESLNPFGGSFDPTDGAQLLGAITPTLLKLPLQIENERTGFNDPSSPARFPYDNRPDSERMFTSQEGTFAARVAKAINEATGGNEGKAGSLFGVETSITPGTIQTLIRGTTGGLGTFVEQSATSALAMGGAEGVALKAANIPILNRLYGEADEGVNIRLASERMREVTKAVDEIKEQIKRGVDPKITDEDRRIYALAEVSDLFSKQMAALRKDEVMVIRSDMTKQEKKLLRDNIRAARDKLSTGVNRAYLDAVKAER